MSPRESLIVLPQLSDSSRGQLLGVLFDQVASLIHEAAAVGRVHGASTGRTRAALAGGLDRPVDVGRRARAAPGDHLARGGVVGLDVSPLDRIDPLIVDQEFRVTNGRSGPWGRRGLGHVEIS